LDPCSDTYSQHAIFAPLLRKIVVKYQKPSIETIRPLKAPNTKKAAKQRPAVETLRASEARYHSLFEFVRDGVLIADNDGYFLDANTHMCELLGYTLEELIGMRASSIIARGEKRRVKPALKKIRANSYYKVRWQLLRKDSSTFDAEVSVIVVPDGTLLALTRDITDRKRTEKDLLNAEHRLRALVDRLHNVREEEARRISRELHDDLGQHLTALNMEFDNLENNLTRVTPDQRGQIARMHLGVDHMIEVVQQISGELRLAQLDVLGLSAAVDWQVKDFSRRSSIECTIIRLDEVKRLPDSHNTALFRILQEGLTNIARHSGATEVRISLEAQKNQTVLKLSDNGRGITQAEMSDHRSIGLIGMRERARLIGGDVAIKARVGEGTNLIVRIPLTANT
jgi:two-component system sensor histidine kinase UhpB